MTEDKLILESSTWVLSSSVGSLRLEKKNENDLGDGSSPSQSHWDVDAD